MRSVAPQSSPAASPIFVSNTLFNSHRVGAAAVYCSDGRFGEQMDHFLHDGLGLPRYDRVAVPGGAACLAGHVLAYQERSALQRQLTFLIREHGLTRVVLIAHEGCAFYKDVWTSWRTIAEQQALDLKQAADQIRLWCPTVTIETYFAHIIDKQITFTPTAASVSRF